MRIFNHLSKFKKVKLKKLINAQNQMKSILKLLNEFSNKSSKQRQLISKLKSYCKNIDQKNSFHFIQYSREKRINPNDGKQNGQAPMEKQVKLLQYFLNERNLMAGWEIMAGATAGLLVCI